MAAQAALIAETIAGMKRVLHGRQDCAYAFLAPSTVSIS